VKIQLNSFNFFIALLSIQRLCQ